MRHLALLVVGLLSASVHALTTVDLYRSEITIDQEKQNGDTAARVQGMKEVIVRASGDREAIDNEVVKKALNQYSQYLSQISYGPDQSSIRMAFSAPHIRSLLSQAQLPFWPQTRSNLLVWLVEDSNFERNISWEHSSTQTLNRIKQQAEVRGLPLTVPVGDFDDVTGIAISDVWGGFVEPISDASQRYPSDAVLVVRAQGNNIRWTLYDQKPASMTSRSQVPLTGRESGSSAAADMINAVSDYYANKDAVVVASESSESVTAEFALIDSAPDFFQLEDKLKSLSSVASLDILSIQGSTVTFKVHLLATQQEFEQEVLRMREVNKKPELVLPTETEQTLNGDSTPTETEAETGEMTVEGNEPILVEPRTLPAPSLTAQSTEMESSVEMTLPQTDEEPVAESRTLLRFEWQGN
ncbi:DUF2066 domain-containing protein [Vibrio sp. ZSDE26]|uniref:DUF2066 domain-containing protein n=1 Tax=Vibrio amylolyticus TaxID=2847292 RepID=A0A9X1XQM1_9VIBR|nr:DUF2066 domain-containing protein [Vibrio amylolyticus]MCK6265423.1 DUF2066 domain-containing protein [Vibrio amylolyticus]